MPARRRNWILLKRWLEIKPLLEDPAIKKVGQNLKYDQHVFANHGIHLHGIAHDTLLQSYVFETHRPHDMDAWHRGILM